MTDDPHTTPLWVTFSSLAWHSDAAKVPQEPPPPEMAARWAELGKLDTVDRRRTRRIVSRMAPHIRWPGERLEHAWHKIFGADPPDPSSATRDALELWDGGDALYCRYPKGRILVIFTDGSLGVSVEGKAHPNDSHED